MKTESEADIMPGHQHHPTTEKLHLLSSPLVRRDAGTGASSAEVLVHGDDGSKSVYPSHALDDDIPELQKHEEPTLLEIFFDLFFAANFNAFIDSQKVTNHARFKGFIGYFALLWLTWFLVTLFDVRYVADSIFSRVTRAIQLGVLVGFVIVAPEFDPTDQEARIMRAMSVILAVSRACLAVEYGSTLWHLRRFKKTHIPLYVQIAIHAIASVIYLGITFRFTDDKRSRVYMTWYFISGAEAIGSIALSNFSPVLSLTKTHLMKRLTLLTVMIMGDGVIQLAKEVVLLVKKEQVGGERNPSKPPWFDGPWKLTAIGAMTIGLVTAAAATIYFLFLIYFDLMKGRFYLPALRQQIWTILHLPFHLALVLHLQSFTQWILWSRIWKEAYTLFDNVDISDDPTLANTTSLEVRDKMGEYIEHFLHTFPPKDVSARDAINGALNNITTLPDTFWATLETLSNDNSSSATWSDQDTTAFDTFFDAFRVLISALSNALFAAFEIGSEDEVSAKKKPIIDQQVDKEAFQVEVSEKTWSLCRLVFAYGYIAAGCTMLFMVVLAILARTLEFKTWHIVRYGIVSVLALGTALTATLWFNEEQSRPFLQGPWVLPPIAFVWTSILIITHVNGPGVKRLVEKVTAR